MSIMYENRRMRAVEARDRLKTKLGAYHVFPLGNKRSKQHTTARITHPMWTGTQLVQQAAWCGGAFARRDLYSHQYIALTTAPARSEMGS